MPSIDMKSRSHTELYISHEEFEKKSLLEKWKDLYHGRKRSELSIKHSKRSCVAFFLYCAVSELWMAFCYLVPHVLKDHDGMARYWAKVGLGFVFVNSLANYFFVRMYDSSLSLSEEEKEIQKRLYEERTRNHSAHRKDTNPCDVKIPINKDQLKWNFCEVCQMYKPPRAHHCVICQKCILKRDHHCYLTGVCIGFSNQRYFVFLTFFTAIACFSGLAMEYRYLSEVFWPVASSYTDFILPVTIFRWMTGSIQTHILVMVSHWYSFIWVGPMCAAFFMWQMMIIFQGLTSHEFRKNAKVVFPKSIRRNFRSVFGDFWFLNFLFPTQIVFRTPGDGKNWHLTATSV